MIITEQRTRVFKPKTQLVPRRRRTADGRPGISRVQRSPEKHLSPENTRSCTNKSGGAPHELCACAQNFGAFDRDPKGWFAVYRNSFLH